MSVRVKRAYEPRGDNDGKRILIDRLWPRGLSRKEARVDLCWRMWRQALRCAAGFSRRHGRKVFLADEVARRVRRTGC